MFEVYFTKSADKQLKKITKSESKSLIKHIQELNYPFPKNFDIKKMTAQNFYRLRVGKIRTLFELDKNKKEIWIRKIDYRGNIY